MTIHIAAMLAGVFVAPACLLWAGHRLRRRSPRSHRMFWGAVIGHVIALVIGTIAAMTPPEAWTPGDAWRGALSLWSFLLLPLAGVLAGMRGRSVRGTSVRR